MSRSYKRNFLTKDNNSGYGKRRAVRSVRKSSDIANGGAYKKRYCSWNICDYRIWEYSSLEAFRKDWENKTSFIRRRFPTWKEAYRGWLKWFRMK